MENKIKTILVVEDDLDILEVIKIILEEKNFSVLTLNNSSEIFNKLKIVTPDLILLDIWMMGMDGLEITKKLKSSPITKQIPVVLLSAANEGEKKAKEVNADDFLAKPFEIEDLIQKINKNLRRSYGKK